MSFHVQLIPTYLRNQYALPDLTQMLRDGPNTALWLTQPRVALGWNQPIDLMSRVLETVSTHNFVVIDEVTDQSFPAHLGRLRVLAPNANLIRVRSFTKPMGLNGFRLSAILHPRSLRTSFTSALDFSAAP